MLLGGVVVAAVLGRFASRRVLRPLGRGRRDRRAHRRDRRSGQPDCACTPTTRSASWPRASTRCSTGCRARATRSTSRSRAQRQLVADASHELRTPVTSLRTNIEVLLADGRAATPEDARPAARRRGRAVRGADRAGRRPDRARPRRRAGRRAPRTSGWTASSAECGRARAPQRARARTSPRDLAPRGVDGVAERLGARGQQPARQRRRHSPAARHGRGRAWPTGLTVRDHGAGVDRGRPPLRLRPLLPRRELAGRQGSGLGLAIVRQVAEQHGGRASAANAPDGGAVFTLKLPASPPDDTGEQLAAPPAARPRSTRSTSEAGQPTCGADPRAACAARAWRAIRKRCRSGRRTAARTPGRTSSSSQPRSLGSPNTPTTTASEHDGRHRGEQRRVGPITGEVLAAR